MALTLKELNNHFYVPSWKMPNGEYKLCSLTEHGRSPYKYLCNIYKKGTRWGVVGYEPTSKIEVIKEQVNDYLKKLEFDSEYFDPSYRAGLTEVLFVHDYMKSLGFRHHNNCYIYDKKNIYDKSTIDITIGFPDLDPPYDKRMSDTIRISIYHNNCSFTSIESNRNIRDIRESINGLLQPLLIADGLNLITSAVQMTGEWSCDWAHKLIQANDEDRAALKRKLLSIAESL